MHFRIFKTTEYDEWLGGESLKSQVQIEKRLSNIETHGHFGTINDVGADVWELKWKSGRRIYYAHIPETEILLLIGGNKNGQSYDIAQAQKILKKYT